MRQEALDKKADCLLSSSPVRCGFFFLCAAPYALQKLFPFKEETPTTRHVDTALDAVRATLNSDQLFFHARKDAHGSILNNGLEVLYREAALQRRACILPTLNDCSTDAKQALDRHLRQFGYSPSTESDAIVVAVEQDEGPEGGDDKPRPIDSIAGLIIALCPSQTSDTSRDRGTHTDELAGQLLRLVPLFCQAHTNDRTSTQHSAELAAQVSLIKLFRMAQGESLHKGGRRAADPTPVFRLGADFLHKWFQPAAEACVIFDASSIRFIHPTSSKSSRSGGNPSTGSTSSSKTASSGMGTESIERVAGGMSPSGSESYLMREQTLQRMGLRRKDSTSYVASTNDMEGQPVGLNQEDTPSQSVSSESGDDAEDGGSGDGRSTSTTYPDSDSHSADDDDKGDDDLPPCSTFDQLLQTPQGRVICSYPNSEEKVPLLACHSIEQARFSEIDGNALRRVFAGYFASACQSGHDSKVYLESGQWEGRASQLRKILGMDKNDGVILCAACFDRLQQPSFFTILLLKSPVLISPFEHHLIELIGICLSLALLRARAEDLSRAQSQFIQKVQHELRTPLHAILGVNETVLYTLRTAQMDVGSASSGSGAERGGNRQSDEGEAKRTDVQTTIDYTNEEHKDGEASTHHRVRKPRVRSRTYSDGMASELIADLSGLTESIAAAADTLSALVDDLVDFSIADDNKSESMRASSRSAEISMPQEMSFPGKRIQQRSLVPWQMILSVLSTTAERCWQLFRSQGERGSAGSKLPPPPELIFWADEHRAHLDKRIPVNIDALRRILWKLVANSMDATTHGIVRVEVRHRLIGNDVAESETRLSNTSNEERQPSSSRAQRPTYYRFELIVEDTGKGMSKEFLSGQSAALVCAQSPASKLTPGNLAFPGRIFEAYQKEVPDSTGLGLSLTLCRATAQQLGGHIVATSELGKGSRLTVSLPVLSKLTTSSDPEAEGLPHPQSKQSGSSSGATIQGPVRTAFIGFGSTTLRALRDVLVKDLDIVDATGDLQMPNSSPSSGGVDMFLLIPDDIQGDDDEALAPLLNDVRSHSGNLPMLVCLPLAGHSNQAVPSVVLKAFKRDNNLIKLVQRPLVYHAMRQLESICSLARRPVSNLPSPASDGESHIEQSASAQHAKEQEKLLGTDAQDSPYFEAASAPIQVEHPFKVLVVEDNPINSRILTSLLKRAGLRFLEARDGVEGVELYKKELPAVVLMDINMPRMNGIEATQAMRAVQAPHVPYIAAITALSSEADRVRGFEAGMDAWFTKPLRMGPVVEDLQRRKELHNPGRTPNLSPLPSNNPG